jgi:hypothetical protein
MQSKERILKEMEALQEKLAQLEEESNNEICDNYEPEFIGKYNVAESTRKSWLISIEEDGTWTHKFDFIEVTQWSNGEGWDIHLETKNSSGALQLHFTQLNALIKLLMTAGAITDDMLLNRESDEE